jgi:CubicO group peptidase (beta-lactamase class C family)
MKSVNRSFPILIALVSLLLAGCIPALPPLSELPPPPPQMTVEAQPEAEPTEQEAEPSGLAGRWEGQLSIAGLNLTIVLNFAQSDGEWSGTIDIPQQGAVGLPLHTIEVDGSAVRFSMLEGAQLGLFSGELEGGSMAGSFTQAGFEGSFEVTLDQAAAPAAPSAGDEIYTDPQGLFTVPIPTNWTMTEFDQYALLASPNDLIQVYNLVLPGEDIGEAVAAAWTIVDPAFDLSIDEEIEGPVPNVEQAITFIYDTPQGTSQLILAAGQRLEGLVYIQLVRADFSEFQRRAAQVQIISTGFTITGIDKDDLTGITPLPVDEEILAALEEYILERMEQFDIPGAVVAVVQGGETVYAQGFGPKAPQDDAPLTPQTQMMIGSTGKTLTTVLMAALADAGLLDWDQPVIEILPDFAVADPELTPQITVQNLVCACTGVPRRDFELVFNANDQSAESVVAELATYEFFTDFGEAFQYSNQMVATGGYAAAAAAFPAADDLYAAYAQALADYITDPMGMANTTVYFDDVLERGDFATPYGLNLSGEYYSLGLEMEELLLPVGPAGSHWSTAEDMAQYLITLLNQGTSPDGGPVVSPQNLEHILTPQIDLSATASYGLGWFVDEYKGLPLFYHGGNTFGFTSDLAFLPDGDVGIVVLTNGRGTNLFNEGVRYRLFELIYAQPFESEETIQFAWARTLQQYAELAEEMGDAVVAEEVEAFLGRWVNEALGPVDLLLADGLFLLDAGEFVSELRPYFGDDAEAGQYVLYDMPLAGVGLRLDPGDDDREPRLILGSGVNEYEFRR